MKLQWWHGWLALACMAIGMNAVLASEAPMIHMVGIPQVADPPPAINGDLERMERVPGWTSEQGADHVVFGRDKWKDDADLSGSVALGWRDEYLYVAAKVTDNLVVQPFAGEGLWRGDHVILLLDVPRQVGAMQRNKVIQIGLSPGNLAKGGPGEVYEWGPHPGDVPGARIGARKTADGYRIEAAIPWKSLGVDKATSGMRIGYDVMLSDADSTADPMQEKVMSLLTSPWDLRSPHRLVEGVLAGSDAKVDPAWIKSPFELIRSNIRIGPESSVKVDTGAADKKPVKELIVRARIDFPTVAGGNAQLLVKLNGNTLDIERIRNRLERIDLGSNQMASSLGGNTWFVFYAPDFKPIPESSGYATSGIDPYEFRFDVSDLWKAGGNNVIELTDNSTVTHPIIADVGVSQMLSPKLEPPKLNPAPTGAIPTIVPVTQAKPDYSYRQLPGGAIELKLGDQRWVIESKYSTTTPAWAKLGGQREANSQWTLLHLNAAGLSARAKDFTVNRTITRYADHLRIVDRITNTSAEDLPVMFTHESQVDRKSGTLYIGGLPAPQSAVDSSNGARPTTLMMWDKSGLGFVSEDDITRAQGSNFADNDRIGIRDDRLVVARGTTVELEFSLYPLDSGDRYAFINRVRRNWDVNFTIQGSEAMESSYAAPGMDMQMTDEQLKDHLLNKSAHYLLGCVWNFNFEGLPSELTPINADSLKMLDRAKAVCPDIVRLVYFHCFLGYQDPRDLVNPKIVETENRLFKADRIERPNGVPADYSNPQLPLFLPTEGSTWAKAQESLIDFRLRTTGVEGIYWDELPYSAFVYDYNPNHWDGVSAEINRTTHLIERKVTNVILATQPWRLRMAKQIMARGTLMGNSGPHTRTFTKLHFTRFVETGLFTNIVNCQLYTPVALGDNLSERNEVDAYKDMVKGLHYGTVYYWYAANIPATHPTLTTYMFPITPINLGQGYIIGNERIITAVSGYFGWGDKSAFQAVVFDRRGHKTDEIKIPAVERDGQTFAEVRIPEGYSVAIVRK